MPRVGFEPTITVFERAKTVHALDRAVTVIGTLMHKSWCEKRTIRGHCNAVDRSFLQSVLTTWRMREF
jgi:hypothetical protein